MLGALHLRVSGQGRSVVVFRRREGATHGRGGGQIQDESGAHGRLRAGGRATGVACGGAGRRARRRGAGGRCDRVPGRCWRGGWDGSTCRAGEGRPASGSGQSGLGRRTSGCGRRGRGRRARVGAQAAAWEDGVRPGRGGGGSWERRRTRMQAAPAGPAGGRVLGVLVRVECSGQGAGGCAGRPFRIPTETRRRGRPQRRPRRGLAWRAVRAMAPLAVGCTRSGRWCRGKRLWRRVRSGPRAGRRRRWQGRRAGRSARRRQRRCGIRMVGCVGWGARAGRREAGARVTN